VHLESSLTSKVILEFLDPFSVLLSALAPMAAMVPPMCPIPRLPQTLRFHFSPQLRNAMSSNAMQTKFRKAIYHEQRLACSIGNVRYQEEWLGRSCTSLSIGPLMVEWWASVKNGEMHIWANLASEEAEEPKGEDSEAAKR